MRLGQRLREERITKGLSVEEVAAATKIRPQFILAIEQGKYKQLPSKAYAQGFVKNYVIFLGLPLRDSLAMFRREFDEREYLDILPESFIRQKTIPLVRIHWKRTLAGVGILLVCITVYVVFQYRAAIFAPSLVILSPNDNSKITSESVTVRGTTDANAIVLVNNQQTYVDTNGNFTKHIVIFPGKSIITIIATNKFGKQTIVKRRITVNIHTALSSHCNSMFYFV